VYTRTIRKRPGQTLNAASELKLELDGTLGTALGTFVGTSIYSDRAKPATVVFVTPYDGRDDNRCGY
jgi:hypothetical protein